MIMNTGCEEGMFLLVLQHFEIVMLWDLDFAVHKDSASREKVQLRGAEHLPFT